MTSLNSSEKVSLSRLEKGEGSVQPPFPSCCFHMSQHPRDHLAQDQNVQSLKFPTCEWHLSPRKPAGRGVSCLFELTLVYPESDLSSTTITVSPAPTRATSGPWSSLARKILKTHGPLAVMALTGHPTKSKWENAASPNMKKRWGMMLASSKRRWVLRGRLSTMSIVPILCGCASGVGLRGAPVLHIIWHRNGNAVTVLSPTGGVTLCLVC